MNINKRLIDGITKGKDQEVLDILYQKLLPVLKDYILKNSGSREDVKDLFQDTLLITYKKVRLDGFVPNGDMLGYMFTIAKNSWKKTAVKEQQKSSLEDSLKEVSSDESGALNTLILREKTKASMDILNALGAQCAELLKLRIYENLDLEEIAQKMNMSNTNVVKSTIYRCKNKLRDKIIKNKGFQNLVGISV